MSERSESDRAQQESWFQRMVRRPEIGSFIVMMIIIAVSYTHLTLPTILLV